MLFPNNQLELYVISKTLPHKQFTWNKAKCVCMYIQQCKSSSQPINKSMNHPTVKEEVLVLFDVTFQRQCKSSRCIQPSHKTTEQPNGINRQPNQLPTGHQSSTERCGWKLQRQTQTEACFGSDTGRCSTWRALHFSLFPIISTDSFFSQYLWNDLYVIVPSGINIHVAPT